MGLFGGSESSSSNACAGKGAEGDNVENGKQALIEKAPRSPYRPLYIMVWRSALFKAHWSFWAPALEGRQRTKGKRAHATGSVRDGFAIEFVRNYDLSVTRSYPTIIEIGAIRIEDLLDTLIDGQYSKDNTPWDRFEAIALSVPAPRASLNQVNEQPCTSEASQQAGRNAGRVGSSQHATEESSRAQPAPRRVVLQDCQYWVKLVVEALVSSGVLIAPQQGVHAGRDPREILATCPRH